MWTSYFSQINEEENVREKKKREKKKKKKKKKRERERERENKTLERARALGLVEAIRITNYVLSHFLASSRLSLSVVHHIDERGVLVRPKR